MTGATTHDAPARAANPLGAMALDAVLEAELRSIDAAGLRRTMRSVHRLGGARILIGGREAIDFASNDYLGLAADPRLASAMAAGANDAGTGAAAARLITGTSHLHEELERALAELVNAECALLFPSGYAANIGVIAALVGDGDIICSDQLAHASLIDGSRLSKARVCVVPHRDLDRLEELLASHRGRARRALIVTEGVYSMDGDRAPLDGLLPIARRHHAWVMLDDAHAIGVIGPGGRGSAAALRLDAGADITVGTLGKAFGTGGAFVAGSRLLIEYLQHRARSFVFSTASSPALAAATLEALRIARDEEWRRTRLRENARTLRTRLHAIGCNPGGDADSAIVPVAIGDPLRTMRVAERLEREGFIVGAIRPPTVPAGTSRLRITLSAAHEPKHLDRLCAALSAALVPDDA